MGYSTKEDPIYLFEGKLKQISNEKTAERWVELLKQPQTDDDNVQLSLVIYRSRNGRKAEKKEEHAINGDTVLGLEKGGVEQVHDNCNRYIALIMKSQALLFQTDEKTCITLNDILKSALRHVSCRIYGQDAQPDDLALHLTSHYLSTTKVKTLRLHRCWPLSDVRKVSFQGKTVSFTMFSADVAAGFKEFTLKNEPIAMKCKSDVEARWSSPMSEKGVNFYCAGPGHKVNPASHVNPGSSLVRAFSHDDVLSISHPTHSPLRGSGQSESNLRSHQSSHYPDMPLSTTVNNPTYATQSYVQSALGSTAPALPQYIYLRKPPLPTASHQRTLDPSKSEPVSLDPSPDAVEEIAPPLPVRKCKPDYKKSLSVEEGRERWHKFVSVLGVEEEIAKFKGKPDKYSKQSFVREGAPANQIMRSDRASIVPQRPSPKPRSTTEESQHQGLIQTTESSYSLYTFLFQVWNSKEITADTLGMKLTTWNNFVVYFELLPGDVKDWKVFAERIGMSHMDIQVIDNYGRRFNQCATAIVMLFWQQNSQNLKEDYSRPVLLKILQELEREDLIEVVTGSIEASNE